MGKSKIDKYSKLLVLHLKPEFVQFGTKNFHSPDCCIATPITSPFWIPSTHLMKSIPLDSEGTPEDDDSKCEMTENTPFTV